MENIHDKAQAREKVGGNADLAKELLGLLLKELPTQKELINNAYTENNSNDFWEHVHKTHGSTAYCGVPALKDCAKQLEMAIKIDKSFPEMEAELTQLNKAIDDLLDIGETELNSDWS